MNGTYEMIKALPGKGTNWARLNAALRSHYLAVYAAKHNGAAPWAGNTTDAWDAAKGIGQLRTAAMEMANCAVHCSATRSSFSAPSQETLSWGGFLGGEVLVWNDNEAEAAAVAEIEAIIGENA